MIRLAIAALMLTVCLSVASAQNVGEDELRRMLPYSDEWKHMSETDDPHAGPLGLIYTDQQVGLIKGIADAYAVAEQCTGYAVNEKYVVMSLMARGITDSTDIYLTLHSRVLAKEKNNIKEFIKSRESIVCPKFISEFGPNSQTPLLERR
jgi:hypothetical protein